VSLTVEQFVYVYFDGFLIHVCIMTDVSFGIDRTHLNATVEIEDKYKTSKDNVRDLRTTSVATGEKDHRSECFRRKWEK